jgi:hypothetical protein
VALDAPLHYFDEMASTYRKEGYMITGASLKLVGYIYVSAALAFSSGQQVLILLAVMFNRMPYRIITQRHRSQWNQSQRLCKSNRCCRAVSTALDFATSLYFFMPLAARTP